MNKSELVGLIREIVKDELKQLLKSNAGRHMVKEMISRSVREEVDHLLTDMEHSQEEVITEKVQETKLTRMVERGELPPKGTQKAQPLQLTKNKKLNDMLNQTLTSLRTGEAQFPSAQGAEGQAGLLREQYSDDEWKAMGSTFTSDQAQTFGMTRPQPSAESTGKSVARMIPNVDVNGNPMMVNPNALPDYLSKALTKNYRKDIKKLDNAVERLRG